MPGDLTADLVAEARPPTATFSTWYVTSPHKRWSLLGGTAHGVQMPLAHAKQVGTTATACGLPTMSWQKFIDEGFVASHALACPDCVAVVRDHGRRVRPVGDEPLTSQPAS